MSGDGPFVTRAWVLHPDIQTDRAARAPGPALEEAAALAAALPDLEVLHAESIRLPRAHPGTLFGSGKVAELGAMLEEAEIDLVLVDGPLSPVQQRNLERAWKVKILDRTGLILEIFSDRARTREGVLQVEMAALSYQRSRLVRAWTHLERQRGGYGFVGGPGETQIEADRRAIDDQLVRLRRQLDKVARTRELHRSARAKVPFPIVALVGYTNAGKSTLFNRMTGAEVVAKDMLFATLDPTMRGAVLPSGQEIILSDTVGFISDLPTQLVAAFRATLEEVLDADLILHVRDIAHPQSDEQAEDVEAILADLGVAEDTPLIEVWNKVDLLAPERRATLETLAARHANVIGVSALTGEGQEPLFAAIADALEPPKTDTRLTLDFSEGRKRAWLHDEGVVEAERQTDTGFELDIRWTARQRGAFGRL